MSDTTRQPRTPLEWAKHVRRYDLTPSAPNPLAEVIEQQAVQIEALRADAERLRMLISDARSALEYHQEQTRPIHSTRTALEAIDAELRKV